MTYSVLAYAQRRAVSSLERLLTMVLAQTGAAPSPVQRAICRLLDGTPLGELTQSVEVVMALGGPERMAAMPPWIAVLYLLSGVRCGKSLIVALAAIRATQVVDVRKLGPGEVPRVSIVSLTLDNANATFNQHVLGAAQSLPVIGNLVVGEPTANTITLRHPLGRNVEIMCVAGSRAGGSLVSRWCAGAIFDEAPRMQGDESVVNLRDQLANLHGRMLPKAQIFCIGSPWAPEGPVYDAVEEDKATGPVEKRVVIKVRASWMNPSYWTPERVEDLRVNHPDTWTTDELGEFMAPDVGLLSPAELQQCIRADDAWEPPKPRYQYAAAMDPATRGNAWSLAVGTFDGQRWSVVGVKQWVGSTAVPLKPLDVLTEIAGILQPYGVDVVMTDQWGIDAIRDLAHPLGLTLIEETLTSPVKVKLFLNLKTHVTDQALSPNETGALVPDGRRKIDFPRDPMLIRDLLSVRRRVTQQGMSIELPITGDGRHADYAVAVALLLIHPLSPPIPEPERLSDDEAHRRKLQREILERQKKQWRAKGFR